MKAALVILRADKLKLLGLRHQERTTRRAEGGVVRRAGGGAIPAALKGYATGGITGAVTPAALGFQGGGISQQPSGVAHGESGIDRIAVLLTKGEIVFNGDQQSRLKQALGVSGGPQELFEHVRKRLPRFASGGVAGESFAPAVSHLGAGGVSMPRQQLPRAAEAMLISSRGDDRPLHIHLDIEGREAAVAILPHLQRMQKGSAAQVRGRHYGQTLALT